MQNTPFWWCILYTTTFRFNFLGLYTLFFNNCACCNITLFIGQTIFLKHIIQYKASFNIIGLLAFLKCWNNAIVSIFCLCIHKYFACSKIYRCRLCKLVTDFFCVILTVFFQFQFVNSFLSLFYIAFYLQDQARLKEVSDLLVTYSYYTIIIIEWYCIFCPLLTGTSLHTLFSFGLFV